MIQALFIVGFLVVLLRDAGAEPPLLGSVSDRDVTLLIWGAVALFAMVGHLGIAFVLNRLDRTGRGHWLRWSERVAVAQRAFGVVIVGVGVLLLGWLDVIQRAIGDVPAIDELIAVSPLLVIAVLGWYSIYPVDRRMREAVLLRHLDEGTPFHAIVTRRRFVIDQIRNQLAFIVLPLTLILGAGESVHLAGAWLWGPGPLQPGRLHYWAAGDGPLRSVGRALGDRELATPIILGGQLLGALAVFAMLPPVMRRVWRTSRLPDGQLRYRLEEICARHGVRIRDILVWDTHGWMLNGAVIGLLAPLRYILLTDALIENLTEDELEAVTAHEVAHIRRRHMLWLAVSLLGGSMLGAVAAGLAFGAIGQNGMLDGWGAVVVTGFAMACGLLVFGYVSRRFEWQADAFAAAHLSGLDTSGNRDPVPLSPSVTGRAIGAMSGALLRVAELNFVPLERFSWRHGSIQRRLERLHGLIGAPANRMPIDRTVGRVKSVVLLAFVLSIVVAWMVG